MREVDRGCLEISKGKVTTDLKKNFLFLLSFIVRVR